MDNLDPHNCTNGFRKSGFYFKEIIMEEKKEMVKSPIHYNHGHMECIDGMIGAFGNDAVMDFCKINAFKYLWRLGHKDDEAQEVGKIKWYLDKYLELKKKNTKDSDTTQWIFRNENEDPFRTLNEIALKKKGLTDREIKNILKSEK